MRKLMLAAAVLGVLLVPLAAGATVKVLNVPQRWQHKDTHMPCVVVVPPSNAPHAWNHALMGCAHCGYYCVPASIAMVCAYRGGNVAQDAIYDNGKLCCGEITGDGVLQTHGLGLFDRSALAFGLPDEVAAGFLWARQPASPVIYVWGPVNQGYPALPLAYLEKCIDDHIPVLWSDHGGWPPAMDPPPGQVTVPGEPGLTVNMVSGHTKVVDGYDDGGTPDDTSDDRFHIVDPWPGSGSPYWIGGGPLQDPADVFYADYDPVPAAQTTWSAVKRLFR